MSKIPIFGIIAHSGTGKTTLIVKLLQELRERGYSIAVIKSDAHGFEIDHEGKDSWRFSQAGAAVTVVTSADQSAIIERRFVPLQQLIDRIENVDLILAEGHNSVPWPMIALYRKDSGRELAVPAENCLAILTDTPLETTTPCFSLNDVAKLADLLISKINI